MSKVEKRVAGAPCGSAGSWPLVVVVVVIAVTVAGLAASGVALPLPLVWLSAAAAAAMTQPGRQARLRGGPRLGGGLGRG